MVTPKLELVGTPGSYAASAHSREDGDGYLVSLYAHAHTKQGDTCRRVLVMGTGHEHESGQRRRAPACPSDPFRPGRARAARQGWHWHGVDRDPCRDGQMAADGRRRTPALISHKLLGDRSGRSSSSARRPATRSCLDVDEYGRGSTTMNSIRTFSQPGTRRRPCSTLWTAQKL